MSKNSFIPPGFEDANDDDENDSLLKPVVMGNVANIDRYPIIHFITNDLLNRKIAKSKIIKDEIKKFNIPRLNIVYTDSIGCYKDKQMDNNVKLGVSFLERLWTLCFDVYNTENDFGFNNTESSSSDTERIVSSSTCEIINKENRLFKHLISNDNTTEYYSLDTIDYANALDAYSNAVWFCFLHEVGHHIYDGESKETDAEENADAFAFKILKKEYDKTNKILEGVVLALTAILSTEDFSKEQNHPWAIKRLLNAFTALNISDTEEIWNNAYKLVQYFCSHDKKKVPLPYTDNPNIRNEFENLLGKLPLHTNSNL